MEGAADRISGLPGGPELNRTERDNDGLCDETGAHLAAYVNKQKARMLAQLVDGCEELRAISLRAARAGKPFG
ncbi:hypothetical protein ABT297_23615 [Dactylosporangium sp. NPDC000555]|uniref:hypothetical protein n=1 Tax=Dactylosporangium sp. NPDC000555 TaxID=3154260 RepID=UPI003323266A